MLAGGAGKSGAPRPPVAVLLPFYGSPEDARDALAAVGRLALGPGDELIVADNTEAGSALGVPLPDGARAVAVPVKRSAYAARNYAAELAEAPWLLFIDADCVPPPDLIERYFSSPPPDRAGALAGEVVGDPRQPGVVAGYVRSREHLSQAAGRRHPYKPMAVTANLLVRRDAWEEVGGFQEGTRSGADAEFCWRLQEAGWSLELRTDASLVHHHRDRLGPLLRQAARDGAGAAWLERRRPGSGARAPLSRELVRAAVGAVAWTLALQPRRGLYKLIDGIWVVATNMGYLAGNAAPDGRASEAASVAVLAQHPLGAAPRGAGRVEASARPERPAWSAARALPSAFAEDDGIARRGLGLAWLVLRHPLRVARDRRGGPHPESLLAVAPAARRAARAPAHRIVAGPAPEDAARAQRLRRLAGLGS